MGGYNDFRRQKQPDIRYKYEHGIDGFGYFILENKSKDTCAYMTIKFLQNKNIEVQAPYKGQKTATLICPPNECEALWYQITDYPADVDFRIKAKFKQHVQSEE